MEFRLSTLPIPLMMKKVKKITIFFSLAISLIISLPFCLSISLPFFFLSLSQQKLKKLCTLSISSYRSVLIDLSTPPPPFFTLSLFISPVTVALFFSVYIFPFFLSSIPFLPLSLSHYLFLSILKNSFRRNTQCLFNSRYPAFRRHPYRSQPTTGDNWI